LGRLSLLFSDLTFERFDPLALTSILGRLLSCGRKFALLG